jgi:protein TonB
MPAKKRSIRSRAPVFIGAAFLVLFTAAVIWMVKGFIENSDPPEKTKVQKISLVKPPPPKPEEKPPEPEKIEPQDQPRQEEVQLDQPPPPDQPASDAPPPGEQLGLDSDGSGSGDGFGLAAKRGGRDITTIGPAKGGGVGNQWSWYDALLNSAVNSAFQQALAREQALKDKNYKVIVKVWIDAGGRVSRAELAESTGDASADEILKDALRDMRALREGPPADMPQPVKVRVTSRA